MTTTLFTVPKPFEGHTGVIQENAIRSWLALRERPSVVLFGDGKGIAEIARRYGLIHVPDVACNERGTPFISDVFARIRNVSPADRYCYINGDIIVLDDFARALALLDTREALVVGRRWNVDLKDPIDTSAWDWQENLRKMVSQSGTLFIADAIDFFAFSGRTNWGMPPFLVGRPRWDNWMIYEARRRGLPVVDITPSVTIVHQNHDYGHIPDHAAGKKYGEEGEYNKSLFRVDGRYNVYDATHVLENGQMREASDAIYLSKRISSMLTAPGTRRFMGWILRVVSRGWLLTFPSYRRLVYRLTW